MEHMVQATSDPPIVGLAASLPDTGIAQLVAYYRQALFLVLVCFLGCFIRLSARLGRSPR